MHVLVKIGGQHFALLFFSSGNARGRLSNLASYEDKSNTYKSVREAQEALQRKEQQLVGQQ